jgi:hypothetical protein
MAGYGPVVVLKGHKVVRHLNSECSWPIARLRPTECIVVSMSWLFLSVLTHSNPAAYTHSAIFVPKVSQLPDGHNVQSNPIIYTFLPSLFRRFLSFLAFVVSACGHNVESNPIFIHSCHLSSVIVLSVFCLFSSELTQIVIP